MSVINKETVKQIMLKLLATTPEQENDSAYLLQLQINLNTLIEPIEQQWKKLWEERK